ECIRMLNGMERTLEKQLPESDRRWSSSFVREDAEDYNACPLGFPEPDLKDHGSANTHESFCLNPEP
ncbi:MAG: hypothetical protein WCL16_09755, partial [bacterium]